MNDQRAQWGSRLGFVLAAAGSAVGLGNIWRFPYQTGEHGGGLFVLVYLLSVVLIGLPVFMAEVFLGRESQRSPVGAFRTFSRPRSPWIGLGWLGVVAAFVILSYYSVVAGWCLHYTWVSITETFAGKGADEVAATFGALAGNAALSTMWHLVFMAMTVSIVVAGIRGGIEMWSKILMPLLLAFLLILLGYAIVEGDFARGLRYVFAPDVAHFGTGSVLAALGQSLFSLSVGMGALITYGSYLRRDDDLVSTSVAVGAADSLVAILAALVVFPIVFAVGRDPAAGPGLVFVVIPNAFAQMPGGMLLAPVFFLLLTFAALTSAISLLEVAAAYFIDERGWSRTKAALGTGGLIALLGIPSAVAGGSKLFGAGLADATGRTWFDWFDYVASNWMLPFGALGIAAMVAWRVGDQVRRAGFASGSRWGQLYGGWVLLLRYVVPVAVVFVFLHEVGALRALGEWLAPAQAPVLQPDGAASGSTGA